MTERQIAPASSAMAMLRLLDAAPPSAALAATARLTTMIARTTASATAKLLIAASEREAVQQSGKATVLDTKLKTGAPLAA